MILVVVKKLFTDNFLLTDSSPPSPNDDPPTDNFISLNHSRTLKNLRRAQLPDTPPDTPQPEPESGMSLEYWSLKLKFLRNTALDFLH